MCSMLISFIPFGYAQGRLFGFAQGRLWCAPRVLSLTNRYRVDHNRKIVKRQIFWERYYRQ